MSILSDNSRILRQRDPKVFDHVFSDIPVSGDLQILTAASGAETGIYKGNYLHSARDPVREAERFVRNRKETPPSIVIMEGFALGHHARAFLSAFPEQTIWLVEPDIDLFYSVLAGTDISDILSNPRILFFFRPEPVSLASMVSAHVDEGIGIAKIRSVYEKDREYYEKIDREVQNVISRKKVNENTLKRFGRLWVRNLFRNLPVMTGVRGLYNLENRFTEYPALVVAAGPSLEKLLPFMQALKERFLIICVDTAAGPMIRNGTIPDILTTVDPQYWNSRHLEGLDLSGTIMVSESSSNPSVFHSSSKALYFCTSGFPLSRYLEETTDIAGTLSPGGSVATAAWETARFLGASEIVCGGLDLGFPGGMTHHRESFFEQRALYSSNRSVPLETLSYMALMDSHPYERTNNRGSTTLTDQRMEVYISWFESRLSGFPELPVFNLSEDGVEIQGMKAVSIESMLERKKIRSELDGLIGTILENYSRAEPSRDFIDRIRNLREEFAGIRDLSRMGLELTDLLEERISEKRSIDDILQRLSELDEKILNSSVRNMAGFLFQNVIGKINRGEEDENRVNTAASNSRRMYSEICRSGEFHLELLSDSINKMEKANS